MAAIAALTPGCAVVWEGADGQRHMLGLGYQKLPAAPVSGSPARVSGFDVLGLALVQTREVGMVSLGYASQRTVTLEDDASVEVTCLRCAPAAMSLAPAPAAAPARSAP